MIKTYEFEILNETTHVNDWCIYDECVVKKQIPLFSTVVAASLESAQKKIDARYPWTTNIFVNCY